MKLFIANTTKFRHEFLYRLPERTKVFNQVIPSGQQLRVHSDDLTTVEIEHILRQHLTYGLVPASDVDREKAFIGLCYSLDKPVPDAVIMRAFSHNDKVLDATSLETRKIALASMQTLAQTTGVEVPQGLELEIVEQQTGQDDNRENRMHQIIQVAQEGSRQAQRQGAMRDNRR